MKWQESETTIQPYLVQNKFIKNLIIGFLIALICPIIPLAVLLWVVLEE